MKDQSPAMPVVKPVELQPTDPTPSEDVAVIAEPIRSPALDALANEEYKQAHRENRVHNFVSDVMKARQVVEPVYTPPPVAEAVAKRTNEEMEAGRRMVEARAAQEALRPKRPVDPTEGRMTPVFRPRDFIPDPKKNQGQVRAETIASS
jgi:hypothetical protein